MSLVYRNCPLHQIRSRLAAHIGISLLSHNLYRLHFWHTWIFVYHIIPTAYIFGTHRQTVFYNLIHTAHIYGAHVRLSSAKRSLLFTSIACTSDCPPQNDPCSSHVWRTRQPVLLQQDLYCVHLYHNAQESSSITRSILPTSFTHMGCLSLSTLSILPLSSAHRDCLLQHETYCPHLWHTGIFFYKTSGTTNISAHNNCHRFVYVFGTYEVSSAKRPLYTSRMFGTKRLCSTSECRQKS